MQVRARLTAVMRQQKSFHFSGEFIAGQSGLRGKPRKCENYSANKLHGIVSHLEPPRGLPGASPGIFTDRASRDTRAGQG